MMGFPWIETEKCLSVSIYSEYREKVVKINTKNPTKIAPVCIDSGIMIHILCRLPTSSGGREVYPLTFFLYEKSLLRASILEESLNLYSNIPETKASHQTETLD